MPQFIFSLLLFTHLSLFGQTDTYDRHTATQTLLDQFPLITLPDTLHVWRDMHWEHLTPISDTILTADVLDYLLPILSPYIEDADTVQAMGRFPLGETHEACMIQIKYSWYVHISWILYDKDNQSFTGARLLSGLDGGDGGQYITESWLMDWDGDGDLDQLWLGYEHAMIPHENDSLEIIDKHEVALFLWENERLRREHKIDSLSLLKRFAIDW